MELGVCADPKFGPALADAGFTFVELHVQNNLKTLEDEGLISAAGKTIVVFGSR